MNHCYVYIPVLESVHRAVVGEAVLVGSVKGSLKGSAAELLKESTHARLGGVLVRSSPAIIPASTSASVGCETR